MAEFMKPDKKSKPEASYGDIKNFVEEAPKIGNIEEGSYVGHEAPCQKIKWLMKTMDCFTIIPYNTVSLRKSQV
jgi:hypothetical protein